MKKWIIIIAVIAVTLMIIRLLMPGDRARIMAAIEKGRAAIEREDIDKVMAVVSLGYRDEYGFAYLTLRKVFADMFGRLDNISVGCNVREAAIKGDTADVVLDVSVTAMNGGQRFRIIGNSGPERMTVRFAKGELRWAAISSRWENFPSIEALLDGSYTGMAPPSD